MEKNELIYLLIMTSIMVAGNVFLHITPSEELKQYAEYVPLGLLITLLGHFVLRRYTLIKKFSKYLVFAPIKPFHYKFNYITKAVHSGVFYLGEMISITVIAMSVFIIGFEMGNENFETLQVWEIFASFAVFPFLGQLIPILMKKDEEDHKEVQEKAGLYYEFYY